MKGDKGGADHVDERDLDIRSLLLILVVMSILLPVAAISGGHEENKQCLCPCPCPEEHTRQTGQGPEHFPKTISIRLVMDVYEPVAFTHESHSLLTDSCVTCHHHSPPGVYKHCVECHPVRAFSPNELAAPGLKGAYHRQCRNCHVESENGPTECVECHAIGKRPSSFEPQD
jgi:hypothetical protein